MTKPLPDLRHHLRVAGLRCDPDHPGAGRLEFFEELIIKAVNAKPILNLEVNISVAFYKKIADLRRPFPVKTEVVVVYANLFDSEFFGIQKNFIHYVLSRTRTPSFPHRI